jgi:hypothetical protein
MTHSPLSLTLNNVDTSMPILVEGRQPLSIKDAKIAESKSGKGFMLVLTLQTVDPSKDIKGKDVAAGFPIIHRFMWPAPGTEFGDGEQAPNYLAQLTRFQLAVLNLRDTPENKAELANIPFDDAFIADLPGKILMCNIRTSKSKEGDEYGPRSEVSSFAPLG